MKTWHLGTDGYMHSGDDRQHRYVMEKHLGRKLETWEHVHHINHNRADNRIENLQVLPASEHHRLHSGKKLKGFVVTCLVCGKEKYYPPSKRKSVSSTKYRCAMCYQSVTLRKPRTSWNNERRKTGYSHHRSKTDGKI